MAKDPFSFNFGANAVRRPSTAPKSARARTGKGKARAFRKGGSKSKSFGS